MRQPNDEMSRDDRLQRYFDGELPAEESDAVREELANDETLSAKLEGLVHLSTLVTAATEATAEDVDSDALFARIEARIADDLQDDDPMLPEAAPADRPALRVIEGEGRAKSRSEAPPAPVRLKPAAKKAEPSDLGGRATLWVVGGGVLAAAAALLFFVYSGDLNAPQPLPVRSDEARVVASAIPHGSEVEEVDFGYSTGAIFSVEGQEGERYAVVWISDEKVEEDEEVIQ